MNALNENKKLRAYLVNLTVAAAMCFISASAWGIFGATEAMSIVKILSDSFVLPGVLLIGVSLIGWVSSKGTFDIFGYTLRGFIGIFNRDTYYKHESFYDYRVRKDEKRKSLNLPRLLVGVVFFLIGIALTVVYVMIE